MSTTNSVRSISVGKGVIPKPLRTPPHCTSSRTSASSSSSPSFCFRRETVFALCGTAVAALEFPAEAMNYKTAVREKNARRKAMREAAAKLREKSDSTSTLDQRS